ncbi:MAG: type II toxin-antitoxin system Phd/YefM family antitoxin [Bifidobacteriaceae bacterium]|jgi:antitoxin (DNA-binding transcriptional repressor) of toxin-antitoxin stability system|nr:type II toxin-antitoxin system Phd/YefM family antitoxin [Bifidobacteriaceae bacterium]
MRTDTQDLISITEASRSLSRLVDEVVAGRSLVVLRNNEAAMAMVPMSRIEQLDALEERESDVRLLALALAREMTDNGVRHELADVLAELGLPAEDKA